jgi:FAD/FMN-containing dehydrogenase/Fe-S oxidoreductase
MIGGMIGNNSCGSYSVFYGTTRDHVKSVEVILSDGSLVVFEELNQLELRQKVKLKTLEGDIYRFIINLLSENQTEILDAFPDESLIRRNTGYALDELIRKHLPFNANGKKFNLASLICGSEGTLGVIVNAKLNLVDLPNYRGLLVAHFSSDQASLNLVERLLDFHPSAVEYIDKPTLEASKGNIQQAQNRVWIYGDPEAVLIVEFFSDTQERLDSNLSNCQKWLLFNNAYHVGLINEEDYNKVWEVRKAGLGLLMGRVGAKKAIAVIEDAVVPLKYLYQYYQKIKALMQSYGIKAVYYGHASVGLIHIRPELDLSDSDDRRKMVDIAKDVSKIVKTYKGSLSGEHGDGRIRAPFLKDQFGQKVYQYLVDLKRIFDPNNLLNPGVIIGDQDILTDLRDVSQPKKDLSVGFNWSDDVSFFYAAEKCSGAGACRKSIGKGVMCPSYKATRDEQFSTRGRANLLRRALHSDNPKQELRNEELKEALDLCLGCKACKKECPASVDMSRLKSEYLFQTQSTQDQLRLWYVRNLGKILKFGSNMPGIFNFLQNNTIVKKVTGIERSMPILRKESLNSWCKENKPLREDYDITVWVVCDLFTQFYDIEIGKDLMTFLRACNVNVNLVPCDHSIVAMISQGLLVEAKNALKTLQSELEIASENDFIVGIEPSEVLVWRDEAKSLIKGDLPKVLLFEELLLELKSQNLLPKLSALYSKVWVHTHCHQKALTNSDNMSQSLKLIPGIEVEILNSGCCGMAGDFGYKHSKISEVIAHQSLDDLMSRVKKNDILIATGTSCRKQISDIFSTKSIHLSQIFVQTLTNYNVE